MDILVQADGFRLGDDMKALVEDKIGRLEQYANRALRARVHLRRTSAHPSDKQFLAKALIELPGQDVAAEKSASQPLEAVDLLTEKLESLLLRKKTERLARRSKDVGLDEALVQAE